VLSCDCRLSVLQLAIDGTVYLLDVLTLSQLLTDDDWRHLVENVFCSESISVVGKCLLLLCNKNYCYKMLAVMIGASVVLFKQFDNQNVCGYNVINGRFGGSEGMWKMQEQWPVLPRDSPEISKKILQNPAFWLLLGQKLCLPRVIWLADANSASYPQWDGK